MVSNQNVQSPVRAKYRSVPLIFTGFYSLCWLIQFVKNVSVFTLNITEQLHDTQNVYFLKSKKSMGQFKNNGTKR